MLLLDKIVVLVVSSPQQPKAGLIINPHKLILVLLTTILVKAIRVLLGLIIRAHALIHHLQKVLLIHHPQKAHLIRHRVKVQVEELLAAVVVLVAVPLEVAEAEEEGNHLKN